MKIDPRTPQEFQHLPKFIVGEDNNPDELAARDFVIHCHYPRFIMEYTDGVGKPTFIDDQAQFIRSELDAGREPAVLMARLMREAGDFFNQFFQDEDHTQN